MGRSLHCCLPASCRRRGRVRVSARSARAPAAPTLVPASDERADWLTATQRSARAVTASLRTVGRSDEIVILQWQPLRRVVRIMADWDCSYEGDEIRHAQLVASICAWLTDGGPITPPVAGLGRWYRQMTPSWMSAEPPPRRRLILRTHRWIAERVLEPLSQDEEPALEDLEADGLLTELLNDAIAPGRVSHGSRGSIWFARGCGERWPGPARSETMCGCAGSSSFRTAFRRESSARARGATTSSWGPSSSAVPGVQAHSRCRGRHRGVAAGAPGSRRPGDRPARRDRDRACGRSDAVRHSELGVPVSAYEEACRAQGRLVLGDATEYARQAGRGGASRDAPAERNAAQRRDRG